MVATKDTAYNANPLLKRAGTKITFNANQLQEWMKCANDPVYFAMNYMKIVNLDNGVIPFAMWPFQQNMLTTFNKNRFVICKMPRQVGKTTSIIAYLLHQIIFKENIAVAILANKGSTAREILGRLKFAYERLPAWLQQGIVEWNKGNIELENGSRVMASSTSSDAIRGFAFNIIFLDEFAFIPPGQAEEFFSSVYPTITSGMTTQVLIVSTPNGLNKFYKMWKDATDGKSGYVPLEVHWSMVPGRDQKFKEDTIANTSEHQWQQEFECLSAETLIKIRDKNTLEEFELTIKELHDWLI